MVLTRRYALWGLRVLEGAAVVAAQAVAALAATAGPAAVLPGLFRPDLPGALGLLLFAALWSGLYDVFSLYRYAALFRVEDNLARLLLATLCGALTVTALAAVFHVRGVGAVFLSVFWASACGQSLLARLCARRWLRGRRGEGLKRRVLIAGTNERALEFARNIQSKPKGYRLAGFVDNICHLDDSLELRDCGVVCDFASLPGLPALQRGG
ncbi:nucleoside-diphosphate sugar epimerase/dehydratase [Desulfohalovibrio reitneri]|uniref:nucleoside-diphosphate sugar epimerase/dehydratase n=1 Tax=Desulfohalovibrio reitneri TaxID=1307759 RepID=UPI000690479F|nr:hypothetical protein [Desulfohalovibrio reitneri]